MSESGRWSPRAREPKSMTASLGRRVASSRAVATAAGSALLSLSSLLGASFRISLLGGLPGWACLRSDGVPGFSADGA